MTAVRGGGDATSAVEPWVRELLTPVQIGTLAIQHERADSPLYLLLAPGRSYVSTVTSRADANYHLHNNEYVISFISTEAIFD